MGWQSHGFPNGIRLLEFPRHADTRGTLVPMDAGDLPFVPKRVFMVEGSDGGSIRGGHSHRSTRQLLICVSGEVTVNVRHATGSMPIKLIPNGVALLLEAGVWTTQEYRSTSDRLLVLASEPYSPDSYMV